MRLRRTISNAIDSPMGKTTPLPLQPLQRAIDHFGSQRKLAKAIGVEQPSISGALKHGRMSVSLAVKVERATNGAIRAFESYPELFE